MGAVLTLSENQNGIRTFWWQKHEVCGHVAFLMCLKCWNVFTPIDKEIYGKYKEIYGNYKEIYGNYETKQMSLLNPETKKRLKAGRGGHKMSRRNWSWRAESHPVHRSTHISKEITRIIVAWDMYAKVDDQMQQIGGAGGRVMMRSMTTKATTTMMNWQICEGSNVGEWWSHI